MKHFLVLPLSFGLLVGVAVAQNRPVTPPVDRDDAQRREINPDLKPGNEPPRSEGSVRGPNESSSKDRNVDISPPPGDNRHPGSTLEGPDEASGITEMKPWNPHKADKDVEVGLYYFKQKNYKAAESRFREALYWQDNHAEATYRLANTLDKVGKKDEARQFYESYLKILPNGDFAQECKKALDRLASVESSGKIAAKPTSRP
ncbi:MAG TPA: tetratricopeptide repeat protein [Terriglobales bacterium]|nr:tetratricopeptide repeat protein [Terriglobales bacterium]